VGGHEMAPHTPQRWLTAAFAAAPRDQAA